MPFDSSVDIVTEPFWFMNCFAMFWECLNCFEMFWDVLSIYEHSTSYNLHHLHSLSFSYSTHCFTFFDFLQIPKPSSKGFLPWGFVFLAFCQVSEQSEENLSAETRQQPHEAADASKVAPCGGMWIELGREMQTFWFFRGDRSGRSSDISCPSILQWKLDNYGTILINDIL